MLSLELSINEYQIGRRFGCASVRPPARDHYVKNRPERQTLAVTGA
jgi:hypothetical protein